METKAQVVPRVHPRGRVTIVVPARNEAEAIERTLRSLPIATLRVQGFGTEVLVLDGASEDGTAELARGRGARVLLQPPREPGKGAAFRAALPAIDGDYVVMIDADATYAPDAIPLLLETLVADGADVVMGSRKRGVRHPDSMTRTHRVGNALLSAAASLLYGRRCTDVCTGLWGFRVQALRSLPLSARGFELEADLFARSSRAGLRIVEVPVDYLPRSGVAKLSGTRDGLRIAWWLLRGRVARRGLARARGPVGEVGA